MVLQTPGRSSNTPAPAGTSASHLRHSQIRPPAAPSPRGRRPMQTGHIRGVAETAFVSLAARAVAGERFAHLRIRDCAAEAVARDLRLDVERYAGSDERVLDVASRSWALDELVGAFTSRYANAQVLNLGAGLSTQFSRLDNGFMTWVDVDLPEISDLRRAALPSRARQRVHAADLTRPDWAQSLPLRPAPTLVVAEGLTMFLEPAIVHRLFRDLAVLTGGQPADLVFDYVPRTLCNIEGAVNPAVRTATDEPVFYRWGIRRDKELTAGVAGWRLMRTLPIGTGPAQPGRLLGRLMRCFNAGGRAIAHLRHVPAKPVRA